MDLFTGGSFFLFFPCFCNIRGVHRLIISIYISFESDKEKQKKKNVSNKHDVNNIRRFIHFLCGI